MRCFLCIEIKDPEIITKLVQFQEELKPTNAKVKFVETENLHFTLKFLGEINESLVKDISSVMKEIPFSPFPMTLQGVGAFPSFQPRVVWVGITEGRNELAAITSFLDQNLKRLGFKPEKREFTPHLTLGRVKFIGDKKSFLNILEKRKDFQFGKMDATTILLKKSDLTQKGPIYTTLEKV